MLVVLVVVAVSTLPSMENLQGNFVQSRSAFVNSVQLNFLQLMLSKSQAFL